MLVDGCLISTEMFDTRWNNSGSGWASRGEKRGGLIMIRQEIIMVMD